MADIAIPCADTRARFYFNFTIRSVSAISIICNFVVLTACRRQQKRMKIYGRMMALAAGCNAFYSLSAIVVGLKTAPRGTFYFYLTDSPFLLYASQLTQQLFVHITFATFYVHAGLPSIQFFIRYKIIKDCNAGLNVLYASFLGLVLFCTAFSSSYAIDFEQPTEGFRELLYSNANGCDLNELLPTYSVIDQATISSRIHQVFVVVILCTSSGVVVYYGLLTWVHFKQRLGNTTYQAKRFNRDINLVLTIQAILPFIFIVLPNTLFLAGLVPRNVVFTAGLIANLGARMNPLLDALIVLFIIPAFRKNVFKPLKGTTPHSSNVVFTT